MSAAGFLSRYLSGTLPYVWHHITVNKICWYSITINIAFPSFLNAAAVVILILLLPCILRISEHVPLFVLGVHPAILGALLTMATLWSFDPSWACGSWPTCTATPLSVWSVVSRLRFTSWPSWSCRCEWSAQTAARSSRVDGVAASTAGVTRPNCRPKQGGDTTLQ